jgi:DNA repair protein RecO (recombination protein O)
LKVIDQGILLRKLNYSETSLIITMYTRSSGIQTFIYQGGKKKASALYPMSRLELEFYKRPDSELGKLTNVQTLNGSSEIPFHPIRSTIAFFMADALFQCLRTEQADPQLFQHLETQIEELDQSDDLGIIPLLFLVRLTISLGIEPMITSSDARFFVPIDGEFRAFHGYGAQAVSGRNVELLVSLYKNDPIAAIDRETRMEALMLLLTYIETHIPGFNVNRSLEVLKEVLN